MQVIRQGTSELMHTMFGISEAVTETFFDVGLFRVDVARQVLIRDEYFKRCSKGLKSILKIELADKYAVSISTVEKCILKKLP